MAPPSSQEVAVLTPILLSLLTTLVIIGIHAVALGATVRFIRDEYQFGRAGVRFWTDVAIVAGVIMLALIAHLVTITIWAMLYYVCGEFTGLDLSFYHSAMNYTSLGYGDIVMSTSWKLFGPLEAADGLLMFGLSAAMIFAVIQRLFQTRIGAGPLNQG